MKRAQVKSFETIAVLMVFFFLLVFGFVFYSRIQIGSLESQQNKQNDIRAINVALKTTHLPELTCVVTGIKKTNCFDELKVQGLATMFANPDLDLDTKLSYYNVFGYSTITIRVLDQVGIIQQEYVVYDNPLNASGFTMMFVPVNVFDPVEKTNAFGYIEVKSYAQ